MTKTVTSGVLCIGLAVACSRGGSGVPAGIELAEMTAGQARDLCEYIVGLQETPARAIDCGNGVHVVVGVDPADVATVIGFCVANFEDANTQFPNCTITVGEAEACFEEFFAASDDELCGDAPLPATCAALIDDPGCGPL